MATDKKLSDLTSAATPLAGTELIYLSKDISGTETSLKTTSQDIADLASVKFVQLENTETFTVKMGAAPSVSAVKITDNSDVSIFEVDQTGVATFNNAFSMPNADGTSGQILFTDGAGNVNWGNGTSITGVITGSGTADTIAKFSASGVITDSIIQDNGSLVTIGGSLNINSAFTLPNVDGTSNQVLKTNGAGVVGWSDDSSFLGTTGAIDNAILRADGTGGDTIQSSLVNITDAGALNTEDGSVSLPAFSFKNFPSSGVYYDTGLSFSVGGTQILKLTTDNALSIAETAAPAVSAAGSVRLYFDSTTKRLRASEDTSVYRDVVVNRATGSSSIALGIGSSATNTGATVVGDGATSTHTASVCFGSAATSTASNQLIVGSETAPANNVFFGKGPISTSPTLYTINGTDASGSGIEGGGAGIAGGLPTDSARGGEAFLAGGNSPTNWANDGWVNICASSDRATGLNFRGWGDQQMAIEPWDGTYTNATGSSVTGTSVPFNARCEFAQFLSIRGQNGNASATNPSGIALTKTASNSDSGTVTTNGQRKHIFVGTNSSLNIWSGKGNAGVNPTGANAEGEPLYIRGGNAPEVTFSGADTDKAAKGGDLFLLAGGEGLSQDDLTQGNGGHVYLRGGKLNSVGSGGTQGNVHLGYDGTTAIGKVTFSNAFTFPTADGTSGQILQTDGAGVVTWATLSSITNNATGTDSLSVGVGSSDSANSNNVLYGAGSAGTGTEAVAIGHDSSAGQEAISIGPNSTASGVESISIGHGSLVNVSNSVAIGEGTTASGANSVVMGSGASCGNGQSSIVIGRNAFSNDSASIAIGVAANVLAATGNCILLGNGTANTASNQFIVGSSTVEINDVYIGRGVTNSAPTSVTINATGGSGTDISGADLIFASGKSTGDASGADILFQTSDIGSSGTTLQTLTTKAVIKQDGKFGIQTATPSHDLDVQGTVGVKRVSVSSSQNTDGAVLYGVQSSVGTYTVTLDSDDVVDGRIITIKDEDGNAATNNITIDTEGAETIDGAASKTIVTDYGRISVYSDGSNWFIKESAL